MIGIPKTIDNDVSYVQKTFGFETAVAEARRATYAANTEAEACRTGIGLVKLMGRDSGFIAAYSVLVDSFWNHQFTHVPIRLAVSQRKKVNPEGTLWTSVLASTGQSREMG